MQTPNFPGGSEGKASAYNAGDPGSIPGSGRSSGEGNGNPLQYSCLENPMDGGAWQATVHGVAKSWTRLSDFTHLLALIDGFFTTAPSGNATEYVDDPTNKNDPLGSVTARLRYLILPVGDLQ